MHAYANASETGDDRSRRNEYRDHRRSVRWRPLELVAMVLGFIIFWPVGLAILGMKMWQRKAGHTGGLADFVEEKARTQFGNKLGADWRAQWGAASMWGCGHRRDRAQGEWRGFGPRTTGNAAFDDWRTAELSRIEEERRKLLAAEQEFAEYMDGLKRARDREEFDRFMNHRRSTAANGESNQTTQA